MQPIIWYCHRLLLILLIIQLAASDAFGEGKIVGKDVVDKWKAYEVFSRNLQGVARTTITSASGKHSRFRVTIKQNKGSALYFMAEEGALFQRCSLANPRYQARIKRELSDLSKSVLEKFTQDSTGAFPGTTMPLYDTIFYFTSPHYCVGTIRLSRFVGQPSLKILNRTNDSGKGRTLVRLDFTDVYTEPTYHVESRQRGSVYLDPSNGWCVHRIKTYSKMTIKGVPKLDQEHDIEFETKEHPSGYSLVTAQTSHDVRYSHKSKRKVISTKRTDYEWEVNESVPDREFTLSAFGLPEPPGEERPDKVIPLYIWILAAAGVCALLAIGFRYLVRRKPAAPAT